MTLMLATTSQQSITQVHYQFTYQSNQEVSVIN